MKQLIITMTDYEPVTGQRLGADITINEDRLDKLKKNPDGLAKIVDDLIEEIELRKDGRRLKILPLP